MKRFFWCLFLGCCFNATLKAQLHAKTLYQLSRKTVLAFDEMLFRGCPDALLERWALFLKKERIERGRGIAYFHRLTPEEQDALRIAGARAQKGNQAILHFSDFEQFYSERDKENFLAAIEAADISVETMLELMLNKILQGKKRKDRRLRLIVEILFRSGTKEVGSYFPKRAVD